MPTAKKAGPIAAAASIAALLSACAGAPSTPNTTAAIAPFQLQTSLAGKSVGEGSINAVSGDRSFRVALDGVWDAAAGEFTLFEDFEFDDGQTYRKIWRLKQSPDGEWSGRREDPDGQPDTVGEARGFQDGDVFRLEYDLRTEGGTVVRLRDVFLQRADGVVINRANISKWGFGVGKVELIVTPVRVAETAQDQAA